MSKQGWRVIAWALGMALALTLAGCKVAGSADDRAEHPNPCAPTGCVVTSQPLYVPQCVDVDNLAGPCVGQVGASDDWRYVRSGDHWPTGTPVALCPTEDGGPVPCAWVPSVQGNMMGDSGAYVFGLSDPGVTAHGPADFADGK